MKFAIISDIHANLEALNTVLAAIDAMEDVENTICLGDVVGYNADPNTCVEILRDRDMLTILGNHDAVACGFEEPWNFNPVAMAAALWTRDALNDDNLNWLRTLPDMLKFEDFIAVHGAPDSRNTYMINWEDILPHLDFMRESECNLCIAGHTHSPAIFSDDGVYVVDDDNCFHIGDDKIFFINPGSVGQPRDGNPDAAFGLLDTEERVFEQIRIPYPVKKAQQRVLEAGLPQFLADRLALGR